MIDDPEKTPLVLLDDEVFERASESGKALFDQSFSGFDCEYHPSNFVSGDQSPTALVPCSRSRRSWTFKRRKMANGNRGPEITQSSKSI